MTVARGVDATETALWEKAVCPFCKRDGRRFMVVPNTRFDHGPEEFVLVECPGCELVFLDPSPKAEVVGRYYEGNYYDGFVDSPEACIQADAAGWDKLRSVWRGWGRRTRTRRLREKASRVERYWRGAPGRLLEVGCASGEFLELMRGRGWAVRGVEMSTEMCRVARQQRRLDVLQGLFDDLELPPESFECITLWSSLEHTLDPKRTLEKVRRLLVTGGIGIVLVPNVRSLECRLFGASWGHLDVPRHISQFDPRSLRHAVESVGFQVLGLHHHTRVLTTSTEQRVARRLVGLWRSITGGRRGKGRMDTLASVAADLTGDVAAVPVVVGGVLLRAGHNITIAFRRA